MVSGVVRSLVAMLFADCGSPCSFRSRNSRRKAGRGGNLGRPTHRWELSPRDRRRLWKIARCSTEIRTARAARCHQRRQRPQQQQRLLLRRPRRRPQTQQRRPRLAVQPQERFWALSAAVSCGLPVRSGLKRLAPIRSRASSPCIGTCREGWRCHILRTRH